MKIKGKLSVGDLLRPHWKGLTVGFLSAIASSVLDVLQPWPLKIILDNVIGTKPLRPWFIHIFGSAISTNRILLLNGAAISLIVLAIADAIASYTENMTMTSVGQWVMHDLRTTVYDHIQRLSLAYHDKSRTGDLMSRVTDDIDTIQDFVTSTLLDALIDVLTLTGMIVIMALISFRFTLVALAVAPFLFFFVFSYSPRIKRASREVRKKDSEIMSRVQEVFSSIRVVKAFSREKYENQQFTQQSIESVELTLRARALKAKLSPIVNIIVAAGGALVLWYGARLVLNGALTAGSLVVFVSYLSKLYAPIRGLSKLPDTFSKPSIALERIEEVMEADMKNEQKFKFRAPDFQGLIEFSNVSFGYGEDKPILKNVSFRIEPGQTAAFVGPTGAGKTTIVSLIPRFYEVTGGSIMIDGWDLQTVTIKSLRKQLGFVLQETILFHLPLWQNIAYGRPSATREEIIEAAKLADADEFIVKMPDGYDTLVGERGVTLSGGQRQRIGIARAIIRNAPILILDEPTSGLDAESEAVVFEALHKLMKGRTSVVITHRLQTIRNADVIFVLKDGEVVEHGKHDELTSLGGLYAELCATQFGHQEVPAETKPGR